MPNDTAPAWPDPTRPGVPLNPERTAQHWLGTPDGTEYVDEWLHAPGEWLSSGPPENAGYYLWYLAPCLTPAEVTAREAAAWAAGAEAMREMAEASADCGCDVRAIVLERLASHGLREAERCCGQHYDACCALTAAAIRALPLPPMPTQGGNADE